ncbi:MAG: fold [Gaiellaceae bacterium]|jgi:PAS domain S-box-containing protein|nr:fold [Gaiellaceae bacterium]
MAAPAGEQASQADGLIQGILVGEAIANAKYIVLVADENMRYLAASDAACELLGYRREELLDLTVPELVVETSAAELYEEFMRDHEQRGKVTLRRKDGSSLEATYDAHQTKVSGPPYYVSVISPVEPS